MLIWPSLCDATIFGDDIAKCQLNHFQVRRKGCENVRWKRRK